MTAEDRARRIRLLLFDVDGVLTDGKIFLFPAPPNAELKTSSRTEQLADAGGYGIHSQTMIEAKGFHAHDGTAVSLARMAGLRTGLITKRVSETVALRARDLRVDHVHQGIADKLSTFEQILREENMRAEEAAFIGDDIVDLPILRNCGLSIAVADARQEVLNDAHWVTDSDGGEGALRDAVDFILRAQGKLDEAIQRYLDQRTPAHKK